jgi:hypothetical protein
MESIVAKSVKTSKHGSTVLLVDENTRQPFSVVLASPEFGDDGCVSQYGLEIENPHKAKPSFLGGVATKSVESLDVSFELTPQQANFMSAAEDRVKQLASEHARAWGIAPSKVEQSFRSSVRGPTSDKPNIKTRLKAAVVLVAPENQSGILTKITIITSNGDTVQSGCGWPWLDSVITESPPWKGARIWPVLSLHSVWVTPQNGLGIRVSLREIIVVKAQPLQHSQAFSEELIYRNLLGLEPPLNSAKTVVARDEEDTNELTAAATGDDEISNEISVETDTLYP